MDTKVDCEVDVEGAVWTVDMMGRGGGHRRVGALAPNTTTAAPGP